VAKPLSACPNEKSFFCTAAAYVPGDKWDFFHPENSKKIIKERVTDHTSWLDAASPLSSHHVFASCRAQPPLCLFVGLFVCCCIVAQNAGTTPSNLPQPPPRVVYLIIVKLYINMKSYDYMISYPPPTSFIVENEQLFKVTRHIMIQSEQLETKDGEWKGASRGGW
jgi:hypothetical protein